MTRQRGDDGAGDAGAGVAPGAAPGDATTGEGPVLAERLLAALLGRRWTVGTAESLTGGLVSAALVSVPGASAVLRGGVVAYATDLKGSVLGVPGPLLAARGAVDPDVAHAMAAGVRRVLGTDVGLATTGVAGPGGQDGHAPGEVHVAVSTPRGDEVRSLSLPGARAAVRAAAVAAVLGLALEVVGEDGHGGAPRR